MSNPNDEPNTQPFRKGRSLTIINDGGPVNEYNKGRSLEFINNSSNSCMDQGSNKPTSNNTNSNKVKKMTSFGTFIVGDITLEMAIAIVALAVSIVTGAYTIYSNRIVTGLEKASDCQSRFDKCDELFRKLRKP